MISVLERMLTSGPALQSLPGPSDIAPLQCLRALGEDPLGFLAKIERDHGKVARIPMPLRHFVLVTDPVFIGRLLVGTEKNNCKSLGYRRLKLILGEGLITSSGSLWKSQRKMVNTAFVPQKLVSFRQVIEEETDRLIADWRLKLEKQPTIDISQSMMELTFSIIMRSLFSCPARDKAGIVRDALSELQEYANYLFYTMLPWPLWVPTATNIRARRAIKALDAVIFEIIEEHRRYPDRYKDLLSYLMTAVDESDPYKSKKMSAKLLRDELITLMLAGHETTAHSLSLAFQMLAENPEVADRHYSSLKEPQSQRGTPSYNEMLFQETMRLYPAAWAVGRESTAPIQYGGQNYPIGTTFFIVQYLVHRNEDYWSEPEKFEPERFRPERIKSLPKFAYFPFGGGLRTCVGAGLAKLEGELILAKIHQEFSFKPLKDYQYKINPRISITLDPGIRLSVSRRPKL